MKENHTEILKECIEDYAKYFKRNLRADYNSKTIDSKQYNSITEKIDNVLKTMNSRNMNVKDYHSSIEYMLGLKDMYDMIFGDL